MIWLKLDFALLQVDGPFAIDLNEEVLYYEPNDKDLPHIVIASGNVQGLQSLLTAIAQQIAVSERKQTIIDVSREVDRWNARSKPENKIHQGRTTFRDDL